MQFAHSVHSGSKGLIWPNLKSFSKKSQIVKLSTKGTHSLQIFHTESKLLQLKLIHIVARANLLMKKLDFEKTKPVFIISVLKLEY